MTEPGNVEPGIPGLYPGSVHAYMWHYSSKTYCIMFDAFLSIEKVMNTDKCFRVDFILKYRADYLIA